jgi:hypothetical protein
MSSELQDLSDNSIKMTRDASKVLSEVMKSVGGTLSVVAKTIVTGEENMDKVLGDFAAVWSKTSDQIQESGLGKWFNEAVAPGGDTTFNADNDGGGTTYNIPTEKDAFTSGAALIIPKDQSQTPYMTSSFDNTYTTPDLGYGEIGNSMPSEGKTNKHDISGGNTSNTRI